MVLLGISSKSQSHAGPSLPPAGLTQTGKEAKHRHLWWGIGTARPQWLLQHNTGPKESVPPHSQS